MKSSFRKLDEQQKVHFVRRVTAVLSIVAILIVIGGYGLNTGSLIALMGIVGLALSLSVQGLLSDFFSGCILAVTRPFSEGDVIEVCGRRIHPWQGRIGNKEQHKRNEAVKKFQREGVAAIQLFLLF